ncbi:hypothetical protein [Salisediminibacterium selenitireducens]|uniref:Uncharacterized protein n=1 Tax=Bacillus selenitireducens (strain ATCC 700615 / DSM 15326 / MLS10) TaxID=439292 RepID=D6XSN8_BACIE|nr:hypothetical protein [Salisediminibacterium selenitireducens]ADH98824.1 hypothetical protein Bsel_1312 [[Bacillus] selenitireducens MLS10]
MILTGGDVTNPGATLHPEGHMNWWYDSMFTAIDAHLFTLIVFMIPVMAYIFYRMGKKKAEARDQSWRQDETEEAFQKLMNKKKIIMNKLIDLEEAKDRGDMSEEAFRLEEEAYRKHLYETERKLHDIIDE